MSDKFEVVGVNISVKHKNWPYCSLCQYVLGNNLYNMSHTNLIFAPQRLNNLLFLLSKEKFDLTIFRGILGFKMISIVHNIMVFFIFAYVYSLISTYVVWMALNYQGKCSHFSKNKCIRIVTTEFLHQWQTSKEHCLQNIFKKT